MGQSSPSLESLIIVVLKLELIKNGTDVEN